MHFAVKHFHYIKVIVPPTIGIISEKQPRNTISNSQYLYVYIQIYTSSRADIEFGFNYLYKVL